jgi:hypothetical protein
MSASFELLRALERGAELRAEAARDRLARGAAVRARRGLRRRIAHALLAAGHLLVSVGSSVDRAAVT